MLDPGNYRVIFGADQHFREIFDDIPCVQDNNSQCINLSAGLLITLTGEQSFTANATLRPLPRISGRVRDAAGTSLQGASVFACNVNGGSCGPSAATALGGEYILPGLVAGRYVLLARSSTYIDEVYPNSICQGPQNASCLPNLANGQVFEITLNSLDLSDIDFVLDRGGALSGSITPHNSSSFSSISVFKEGVTSGAYRSISRSSPPSQSYRVDDLEPGRYRIIVSQSFEFFSQIYPQINCSFCDISLGTWIDVGLAQDTPNINFNLAGLRVISGRVIEAGTGNALPSIAIDFWQQNDPPQLPTLIGSALTNAGGFYSRAFQATNANLLVSTDASAEYFDQIHSGIACPLGASAYDGNCGFTGATRLLIPAQVPGSLDNINFVLQSTAAAFTIFKNGFEN